MKVYTYEEKMKWIDNAKYPKIENDKYMVKVPIGMETVLIQAMQSKEWRIHLGRKASQKAEQVMDMAMLIYDLVHFDLWTGAFAFDANITEVEYEDLNQVPMEERVWDFRFDKDLTPVNGVSIVPAIQKHVKNNKNPIYHRGEHSIAKGNSKSISRMENEGYKRISLNLLRRYYDNRSQIENILHLLSTPYRVQGHNTVHQIMKYETNAENRYVQFDEYLLQQTHKKALIARESFVKGYRQYVREKWEEMIQDPFLSQSYGNQLEMELPNKLEIWEMLESSVGNYHKGKCIVRLADVPCPKGVEDQSEYVWVENMMVSAFRYSFDYGTPVRHSWRSEGSENGRHYSSYNMMPSLVRKELKWHGKKLTWVDVNGCHIILLLVKYANDRDTSLADRQKALAIANSYHPRKRIAELAGIEDTPWFKESILSWINCETWMMDEGVEGAKYAGITTIFKSIGLGNLVEWLKKWKNNAKHEAISYWLQNTEAKLMDRALEETWKRGIQTLGCHDGIDCDPERVDEVRGIIEASFAQDGYPCSMSDDRDEHCGAKAA